MIFFVYDLNKITLVLEDGINTIDWNDGDIAIIGEQFIHLRFADYIYGCVRRDKGITARNVKGIPQFDKKQ